MWPEKIWRLRSGEVLPHIFFSSSSVVSIFLRYTLVSDLSPMERVSISGDGEVVVHVRDSPAGRRMEDEGKELELIGNVKVKLKFNF